jgi:Amt family ammonium transporter
MFGTSGNGWIGLEGFFLEGKSQPYDYAYFIFQAVFAGTAATIVSGAVAERMRFEAYLISTVIISALIYPLYASHYTQVASHRKMQAFLTDERRHELGS